MITASILGHACRLVCGGRDADALGLSSKTWVSAAGRPVAMPGEDAGDFRYVPDIGCRACCLPPTKDGFDPCLGEIEGADSACCGHGSSIGRVSFPSGVKLFLPMRPRLRAAAA